MSNDTQIEVVQPLLSRISSALARGESVVIGALMVSIFVLLMLNVVSRALGSPVIWVDEAAVFLMIWVALFGASLALAKREHLAVTLLSDTLTSRPQTLLSVMVDLSLFGFFVIFAIVLWRWFDPLTLWRAGSVTVFSRDTFNFIYQEPTVTLGLRKVWVWLILPVFCLNGLIHTGAQLVRSRGDVR
jgi:TRAP-type C4-dicarboxylate transport system permease small subunit